MCVYHSLWATLVVFKTSLHKRRIIWADAHWAGVFWTKPAQCQKLRIEVDHAADDTVLYWTWYLLPKLPWVQQGLVLALSSSQTLISTAIGRIAPTSPGGTQAWSRFHGDETYPGLRFHFVYISQQYYKEIVPGRMSATWGRQVEERESPGYRRELWEFLPNQGELGSHLAKKRSELPLT